MKNARQGEISLKCTRKKQTPIFVKTIQIVSIRIWYINIAVVLFLV